MTSNHKLKQDCKANAHGLVSHPTFVRCWTVAANAGSTAKTVRGVARFMRDSKAARRNLFRDPRPMNAAAWKPHDKARKADPDAKRARTDKAFRRRFLAGLNRREARAIACDGTIETVMWYYDPPVEIKRCEELAECARLRQIVTGKPCKAMDAPKFGHRLPISESTARQHKARLIMRGKDASVISTKRPSYFDHQDGETEWKNGKAVKYTRATNDNYVRSLAVIRDAQTLDYVCHETRYTITLPDGFAWNVDQYGLRAVMTDSPKDDYHVSAYELSHDLSAETIASLIGKNRETRIYYAAVTAAEAASVDGIFVCLADSVRAGNCRQGSIAFAQRHNLNLSQHYAAPVLLAQANGEAGRVRLAITAARIRHERETANGFCLIFQEEHT